MAKRFTETGIWEKEWFMKLSPKHKCLFRFLTEKCDHAGVWEPNWQLATIYIGEKCDMSDLMVLNDQVEKLSNGKIWLPGFINFQYGKLSEKSPAHIPVFKSLVKNNLTHRVFNRVSNTLMDEDKEKDMVKEVKGVQGENETADFADYEKWTADIITGNDWHFADKVKNMNIQVNGKLADLARSHLALLAKYPKMKPPDQNRFRLSLIGFLQEKIEGKPPPGTKKKLTIEELDANRK